MTNNIIISILIFCLLTLVSMAGATELYVDDEAGVGHYSTMAAAYAAASNGDVISLRKNITESLVLDRSVSPLTIIGEGDNDPTNGPVWTSAVEYDGCIRLASTGQTITVRGIDLDAADKWMAIHMQRYTDNTLNLNNCIVRGGNLATGTNERFNTGVALEGGFLKADRCRFYRRNRAISSRYILYSMELRNCLFTEGITPKASEHYIEGKGDAGYVLSIVADHCTIDAKAGSVSNPPRSFIGFSTRQPGNGSSINVKNSIYYDAQDDTSAYLLRNDLDSFPDFENDVYTSLIANVMYRTTAIRASSFVPYPAALNYNKDNVHISPVPPQADIFVNRNAGVYRLLKTYQYSRTHASDGRDIGAWLLFGNSPYNIPYIDTIMWCQGWWINYAGIEPGNTTADDIAGLGIKSVNLKAATELYGNPLAPDASHSKSLRSVLTGCANAGLKPIVMLSPLVKSELKALTPAQLRTGDYAANLLQPYIDEAQLDPNLKGWHLMDEPGDIPHMQTAEELRKIFLELDPDAMPYTEGGWHQSLLYTMLMLVDVPHAMPESYLFSIGDPVGDFSGASYNGSWKELTTSYDELESMFPDRIIAPWLQAFSDDLRRLPTEAELTCTTWIALAKNAKAIGFFGYSFLKDYGGWATLSPVIASLCDQIDRASDILVRLYPIKPDVSIIVDGGGSTFYSNGIAEPFIDEQGDLHIIAVNRNCTAGAADTITLNLHKDSFANIGPVVEAGKKVSYIGAVSGEVLTRESISYGGDYVEIELANIPAGGGLVLEYRSLDEVVVESFEISGSALTLKWKSRAGRSYTILWSTDLDNWAAIPVGVTNTWSDPDISATVKKFYRVLQN